MLLIGVDVVGGRVLELVFDDIVWRKFSVT